MKRVLIVGAIAVMLIATIVIAIASRHGSGLALPDAIAIPTERVTSGETLLLPVFGTDGSISILSGESEDALRWTVFAPDGTSRELDGTRTELQVFSCAPVLDAVYSLDFGISNAGMNVVVYDDDNETDLELGLREAACSILIDDVLYGSLALDPSLGACTLLGIGVLNPHQARLEDGSVALLAQNFVGAGEPLRGIAISDERDNSPRVVEATLGADDTSFTRLLNLTGDNKDTPAVWRRSDRIFMIGDEPHRLPEGVKGSKGVAYTEGMIFAYERDTSALVRWDLESGTADAVRLPSALAKERLMTVYVTPGWVMAFNHAGAVLVPRAAFDTISDSSEDLRAWVYLTGR